MKKLSIIISVLFLTGCLATTSQSRQQYISNNPQLSEKHTAAILEGSIMKGMTQDDVRASWGPPCSYCYGTRRNSWGDTWEYNVFGTGSYGAGSGAYVFFDEHDRVSGWSE